MLVTLALRRFCSPQRARCNGEGAGGQPETHCIEAVSLLGALAVFEIVLKALRRQPSTSAGINAETIDGKPGKPCAQETKNSGIQSHAQHRGTVVL